MLARRNPDRVRVRLQDVGNSRSCSLEGNSEGIAILADVAEFVRREARRNRNHDRAHRERRIEQLDDFNAVRKKQDNPVAGTSAALPQPVRHTLNSQLKFTIGEPLVSADQRDLVGTAHRLCAKNVFQAHAKSSDDFEGWILDFVR